MCIRDRPGTGKTSTVLRILALLTGQAREQPLRIALAAPTGKAAGRLQESIRAAKPGLGLGAAVAAQIPEEASTLHRLLGGRPDSVYFRHDHENPLPLDILVVDEVSMVGLALMAKTVAALPPAARLILLGDKDQLASVCLLYTSQDPAPVQYAIFQRIYAGTGKPVFLVGDPKQAIYIFRGADIFACLLYTSRCV